MRKTKHFTRLDHLGLESKTGRLFFDEAKMYDLSGVHILHAGVDTVRQLYKGYIKPKILDMFETKGGIINMGGYEWVAGRIGRDSGYQFKLQNADIGLVVLIKNFNVKVSNKGPHLKIEVSPHLIDQKTPSELQVMMNNLANEILDEMELNQSAAHIAVDVQGWEPPSDLDAYMHCRSTQNRTLNGIDSIDFAELSVRYNRGQSFLFGSPSGIQLAIYNKSVQAKATDKLDYWQSIWKRQSNPFEDAPYNYDPEKPVWRIELRFHHSVVQQFADGCIVKGEAPRFRSFLGLAPHLDGLWQYGLNAFKYMARPGYFHPMWSVLAQDVRIETTAQSLIDQTEYKRYYKTSAGFSGKNIELLLGNAISLAARERLTIAKLLNALQSLPFWPTIKEFYQDKGMSQPEFYQHIDRLLKERYLRWGKAV